MHVVRVLFSRLLCCLFMGHIIWMTLYFLRPIQGPHCNPWEHNLKLSLFESSAFFSWLFSLLESAMCLWIQVHPLWIQGLKMLVMWTQNLTLLEDQGLWIQTFVLHLSYAKAASFSDFSQQWVGFAYRHLDRHPLPVSPDTIIVLPISSTRYRHPVLDDRYQIAMEFWCGTGC